MTGYGIAAVAAVAVGAAGVQAKKKRDSAAVVALYNKIVELPDPGELSPEIVKSVGDSFGINMHKDDLEGLCKIYGQYLEAIIPTGDQQLRYASLQSASSPQAFARLPARLVTPANSLPAPLRPQNSSALPVPVSLPVISITCLLLTYRGDEAPKLIAFKAALELTDEDAAPVHVEVARRLFRQVRTDC